MNFSPYHQFKNQSKLKNLIIDFNNSRNILNDTRDNFNTYNSALIHKLKSAKYNLDRLEEKLTQTDIQEAADITGDFLFEVNMFIDGFFYSAGSAMDILARVVLTLFGENLPDNVYFETAYNVLNARRPGDSILARLSRPSWKEKFSNYRNALTHELIIASKYHIEIDPMESIPIHRIVFPLADDPRATQHNRTYKHNPNVFIYLTTHFKRILRLVNTIYGDIYDRAFSEGSLPL